jgi:hypothetical protein
MKKNTLIIASFSLILWGCPNKGADTPTTDPNLPAPPTVPSFNFTVAQDESFTGLPGLQSFVFGTHNTDWLMMCGRVNGFHGFPTDTNTNFPRTQANPNIFVYDVAAHQLYTMPVPKYGGDTGNVFLCTNLGHTQQDGILYAGGGYGVASAKDNSAKKTYNYFMRVDLSAAIAAVKANNPMQFKNAIWWGQSDLVKSTGGELFLLPDNNFYMALGHNFEGRYTDATSIQKYINQVNVFKIEGKGLNKNKLAIIPVGTISDGLPDSTTQFHRRDLVVAPCVQANGLDIGLSIYGGVFTYAPTSVKGGGPSNSNGNPFPNPIYINYKQTPAWRLDAFSQVSNIYSTAFMTHYDAASQQMMTTLFGGLGDTQANFNAANWTNLISTNVRSYANKGDVTTSIANASSLSTFVGAESVFVPDNSVTFYNKNYNIIDYSKLSNNQTVGYIYGGIVSNQCCNDTMGSTKASSAVYKVIITKK